MELKDLKKLARSLKMPGSSEFFITDSSATISWRKKGGYAGDNAISKVLEAAKNAGFVHQRDHSSASPDGSTVRGGTNLSKDNVSLYVSSAYGVTKSENRFTIRVTVTG